MVANIHGTACSSYVTMCNINILHNLQTLDQTLEIDVATKPRGTIVFVANVMTLEP
jgi:hypothetical protein